MILRGETHILIVYYFVIGQIRIIFSNTRPHKSPNTRLQGTGIGLVIIPELTLIFSRTGLIGFNLWSQRQSF